MIVYFSVKNICSVAKTNCYEVCDSSIVPYNWLQFSPETDQKTDDLSEYQVHLLYTDKK